MKRNFSIIRSLLVVYRSRFRVAMTFAMSLLLVGGLLPGRSHASSKRQRSFNNTFSIFTRKYRRFKDLLSQPAWSLSGSDASGENLTLIFTGSEARKNHFARAAFGEHTVDPAGELPREQPLGPVNVWQLGRQITSDFPGCAMMVTEVQEDRRKIEALIPSDLIAPLMMPVEIPLAGTVKESLRKSAYDFTMRKIRQNALACEIRSDAESFEDFFHNMYVPYMVARHGNRTVLAGYDNLKDRYRHGELIFVNSAGQSIGAMLVDYGKESPRLLEMGIRDGKDEYARQGVANAAYYFTFERILAKVGPSTAELGNSSGFLYDGPLAFKISLGGKIGKGHYGPAGLLHIKFVQPAESAKNFLIKNPMVTTDGDGNYFAAVFAERDVAMIENAGALFAKFCNPNLRPLLYLFDGPSSASSDVPGLDKLPADVTIHPASKLFS